MAKITVIDAQGNPAQINEENLGTAQQRGARLPSAEESQGFADKAEYGDGIANPLKAAALGAARTLTFGGSDYVAKAFGGRDATESVRKLAEQNPIATVGGELAGAVAPALLTGGESLAAQGGELAGGAVRAVEGVGMAAERGAASLAKSLGVSQESGLLARTIAKGASKAAEGAVQGAAQGLQQSISESALEDKELTAEQIMQHVGAGALLGGLTGGALGAGGELAVAGGRAIKNGVAGVADSAQAKLRELFTSGSSVKDKIAKASSLISGHDESVISEFANDVSKVHTAENADHILDGAARKTAAAEDELRLIMDDIVDAGTGEGKRAGLKFKVNPDNIAEAYDSTQNIVAGMRSNIDNLLSNADEFGNRNAIKKADSTVRKLQKFLEENGHGSSTSKVPIDEVNAELFYQLDNAKRDLQKITKSAKTTRASLSQDRATFENLNELQNGLRTHLENTQVWGQAGEAQAGVNKAWTNYLGNEKYAGANLSKKVGESEFESLYQTDPDKVLAAFKRVGTAGGDTLDAQYFARKAQFRDELLATLQREYGDTPELAKRLARARQLTDEINGHFEGVRNTLDVRNKWQSLAGDNGIGGALPGAAIGGLFGGGVGAYVGGSITSALGSPQRTLRQIANAQAFAARMKTQSTVTDAASAVRDKAAKAIDGFLGAANNAAARAARIAPRAAEIISNGGATALRPATYTEDHQEHYDRQVSELTTLAQNPQAAVDRLAKSTQGIATTHPQVTQAIQMKSLAMASFLLSKKPPSIQSQSDLLTGKKRPVSKNDLAQWNRYVRTATQPASLFDDLAGGHISNEAAETMRTLYPSTVAHLQTQVLHRVADGATLSHKQALVLGRLFNTPLDGTQEPSFIAAMQLNWSSGATQAAAQQAANPQQPAVARLAKTDMGKSDLSRSEMVGG